MRHETQKVEYYSLKTGHFCLPCSCEGYMTLRFLVLKIV